MNEQLYIGHPRPGPGPVLPLPVDAEVGHRLTLPWPPSTNRYWRSIVIKGSVRVLLSSDAREYGTALSQLSLEQRWPRNLAGRISIDVIVFPPDKRARDLDNVLKPLLDALKVSTRPKDPRAGVYLDDAQIDVIRIRRGPVSPPGFVHALVREIPTESPLAVGAWPDGV